MPSLIFLRILVSCKLYNILCQLHKEGYFLRKIISIVYKIDVNMNSRRTEIRKLFLKIFIFSNLFDIPTSAISPSSPPGPSPRSPLPSQSPALLSPPKKRQDFFLESIRHGIWNCWKICPAPCIKCVQGDPIWEVGFQKPVEVTETPPTCTIRNPIGRPSYTTLI